MIICLIQYFDINSLWKVSLKILNLGIILNTFNHVDYEPTDKTKEINKTSIKSLKWLKAKPMAKQKLLIKL